MISALDLLGKLREQQIKKIDGLVESMNDLRVQYLMYAGALADSKKDLQRLDASRVAVKEGRDIPDLEMSEPQAPVPGIQV